MSLAPLNRDPKYMSGEYANMFNIPVHPGNNAFASNPYRPATCFPGESVCFSLKGGMLPCKQDPDTLVIWRPTGDLTELQLRQKAQGRK